MDNIFNEAGRASRAKKHKKTTPTSNKKPDPIPVSPQKYNNEDAELARMFDRIKEMKTDIEQQLEAVYEQGKRHHIDIDRFINNLPLEARKEYEKIKEIHNQIKTPSSSSKTVSSAKSKKSAEKLTQERKDKMRGVRQKWIPIH